MTNVFELIGEITYEALCGFKYFIKINLMTFANIINWIIPYAMYFAGQYVAAGEIKTIIGQYGEVLVPLFFMVLIYYLKSAANKFGKGTKIPVPESRFTTVDGDGEASIENNRLQELILYVADLEDWMERKGML
jgi:hypothetical protein